MFTLALAALSLISSTAHAGWEAIGEPNVTWLKRSVHVCWHDGAKDNPDYKDNDFEKAQKEAVQKIVEQEYTIERTGITFTGWEDCSTLNPADYDLEIYQDNELAKTNPLVEPYRTAHAEGYAVLGQGTAEQIKTETDPVAGTVTKTQGFFNRQLRMPIMYLLYRPIFRIFSDSFKATEELQMTALHEFGHVAGLRHEHIREEAKTDPNCKLLKDFKFEETRNDTSVDYDTYDPNSIMNYCWGAALAMNGTVVKELPNVTDTTLYTVATDKKTKKKTYTIKIGLSAKDIAALNKLYPKQ